MRARPRRPGLPQRRKSDSARCCETAQNRRQLRAESTHPDGARWVFPPPMLANFLPIQLVTPAQPQIVELAYPFVETARDADNRA
jgi:hypothetical protein